MSLKTWAKTYMPRLPASVTPSGALVRDLRMVEGLRPINLREHRVHHSGGAGVYETTGSGRAATISGWSYLTLALCHHFMSDEVMEGDACYRCPVRRMRGRSCVNEERAAFYSGNPKPMLTMLTQLVRYGLDNKTLRVPESARRVITSLDEDKYRKAYRGARRPRS
jgi:hypothetical protein